MTLCLKSWTRQSRAGWRFWLPWLLIGVVTSARAEQLPFRHYGNAEGIAETQIIAIYQDRKGYLWFAGNDGVSRFDGYRFRKYGIREGLCHPLVTSIAEDRAGYLWVDAGLASGSYRFLVRAVTRDGGLGSEPASLPSRSHHRGG